MVNIGNDWDELLKDEWEKPYYLKLRAWLSAEYGRAEVYPQAKDIFNAFKLTPYSAVKAVIIGQDPYHEPGQAHGLAFSVQPGVQQPPSLVNIFKELQNDLGITPPPYDNGCLIPWARSGVLLLNTSLTVRAHQAGSHRGKGWEQLTDRIIGVLNEREKPIVFILWGANARSKEPLITNAADPDLAWAGLSAGRHLVITGPHPSPLSAHRGFFGGRYFSRANDFLTAHGLEPVDWNLSH